MGAQNAKSDLENYRAGYPDEVDDPDSKENLRFYKGERKSEPDGDYIDEIHKKWWGRYSLLERHHGYIQWLFPIQEHGMNYQSQKLQKHEIAAIKADPVCLERILKSYELMLDFYGMVLKDRQTGELARNPDNWKDRYSNLNHSSHNYLRITRILKCLGEMGFEHLKLPFLQFVAEEVYVNKQLRNVKGSLANYWSGTLRNDDERAKFLAKIEEYDEKERQERAAAGGGPPGGRGGYGAGGYGGVGYRVGAESRFAANNDSSDEDEDEMEGSDEDLTVAEKEKQKRNAANAGNPPATAANSVKEEGEKEGDKKAEDEQLPPLVGDDDRCCQTKEGQAGDAQPDLGNESAGTQSQDINN